MYDRLFSDPDPDAGENFLSCLNPRSLDLLKNCMAEPSLAQIKPGERYQFERQGYYCVDPDSTAGRPVFNQTVALKDTWAKIEQKLQG